MSSLDDNQLDERVRRLFGDMPVGLQVAALPWRVGIGGLEVLLVTSRDTGRWVLPKGWVEKKEEQWQAAAREAIEEAGVRGDVSRSAVGRYFYEKVQKIGRAKPCEVVVYPLAVAKIARDWKEKGQRDREWFSPEVAADLVDEIDLGNVIRRFGDDPGEPA